MNGSYSEGRRKPGSRKKTYRRPAILSREKLEVLAVICNDPTSKTDGLSCTVGTIVS